MRGFARVSVAVPHVQVGSFDANVDEIIKLWKRAHDDESALVVFPELALSSYTARDLFFDATLHHEVHRALGRLVQETARLNPLGLVGMPLLDGTALYNVAVAVHGGRVLGVVPKMFLPTYREFEERRWFRPGTDVKDGAMVRVLGGEVPFGGDLLFESSSGAGDLVIGAEICEDVWVQSPPSMHLCSAGALVVANLSASNFTIGKADLRRMLCESASDRGKCAYLYVAAGPGESSTDLAFDADAFVCENGNLIAESKRFARESQVVTVDIDLQQLLRERMVTTTFQDCARLDTRPVRRIPFSTPTTVSVARGLKRDVPRHPFLPRNPETLARRCWEMFEIQTNALATRMQAIGKPKLVLGVSGGLDSTLAALVATTALDMLGQPRSDLRAVTMPGLGTSQGTKDNAGALSRALGAELETISIADASRMVLAAVGHPAATGTAHVDELIARVRGDAKLGDVSLENAQARMRTLVLMTIANRCGGVVVGTGDLSEKALGWSTYSGDHISMYDVNAGVPKTLIQFVIKWVANERVTTWANQSASAIEALRATLFAILDTPISPELLPPDVDGKVAQLTETAIGPYELHDFYLFHLVRHGRRPGAILDLARVAFRGSYDDETLRKHLRTFVWRFFVNQFKRSCTADGPKVGTVALSPRGDWRMPSDAKATAWLADVDAWRPEPA